MAPIQTQTITTHHFPHHLPVLRGRISKSQSAMRSTRSSKALLDYSPQIPAAHAEINMSLLRNKLLLACRQYVSPGLLHDALADGLYSRASHWITSASLAACRHGKSKRYFVLYTDTFLLEQVASAWEARVCSGSQPIDAGNGVVLFVRERKEWDAFLKGYRQQGRRAGQLMRLKQKDTEREWREKWKRKCGDVGDARKEVNAGPMWVLIKCAIQRIIKGEA